MLIRPLLERRPDLADHDKHLFFQPVGHYWRAIACGHNGRRYRFKSFVYPLFAGSSVFLFWGSSALGDDEGEHRISASWSDPERASMELCDLLERQLLSRIAKVVTPEELAKYPRYENTVLDSIFGACFNGDFDEAERCAVDYVRWYDSPITLLDRTKDKFVQQPYSIEDVTEDHRFNEHMAWRVAYLTKLLQTDRSRVPELLHDWEKHTVNAFKLNDYWTRTPFPCER